MMMLDAISDGLSLLKDVFGYQRKLDDHFVKSFMFVIQDLELNPYDVEKACQRMAREGGERFPTGPVFRRFCSEEKYRRERLERFQAARSIQVDVLADDDEWISQSEAKKIVGAALARMTGKQKDWPGEGKPRDMKREIARMKSA